MSRGFTDSLLLQLAFWIAVALAGLTMLYSIGCKFGVVC
jgi:hypothetical protein